MLFQSKPADDYGLHLEANVRLTMEDALREVTKILPFKSRDAAAAYLRSSWEIVGKPPADISIMELRKEFNQIELWANKLARLPSGSSRRDMRITETTNRLNKLLIKFSKKYWGLTGDMLFLNIGGLQLVMTGYWDGLESNPDGIDGLLSELKRARPALGKLQKPEKPVGNRAGKLISKQFGSAEARFAGNCAIVWWLTHRTIPGGNESPFAGFLAECLSAVTGKTDPKNIPDLTKTARTAALAKFRSSRGSKDFLQNARAMTRVNSGDGPIAQRGKYILEMASE